MSLGYSQIYGDDLSATFATPSTDYHPFPGSTLWTGQTNEINHAKPEPKNTTGIRFVTGNEGAGAWHVGFNTSFSGSVGNNTYHIALFKNGTKIPMCSIERKLGTAGDIGAASVSGLIVLKESTDVVDFRVQTQTSGAVVTINHLNVYMEHVSTNSKLGIF